MDILILKRLLAEVELHSYTLTPGANLIVLLIDLGTIQWVHLFWDTL